MTDRAAESTDERDARMAWWREARFGVFVHWGVYAQWAGSYRGHAQIRGGAEWIMNRCKIGVEEYRERAASFDPVAYDPDEWARRIAASGAGYVVVTAKHHDGFALFETAASDWNAVDATAAGRDLLRPLADACRRQGLRFGVYYSQSQDWVHPGGATARKEMAEGWPRPDAAEVDAYTRAHGGSWDPVQREATFDEYVDRVAVPQVRELLTGYGDIAMLFWDTPMDITVDQARRLERELSAQPGIITNDRLKRPDFPGDMGTPEQHVPAADELDGRDWETCMTMNGTWGFNARDHAWKSSRDLVRSLVDAASKGGNFLLNVGPRADGSIPEESRDRLARIGAWLDAHGEAIRGTSQSPIEQPAWGRITARIGATSSVLFCHVFDWPSDGALDVAFVGEPSSARVLGSDAQVAVHASDAGLRVALPADAPDPDVSVVAITVAGPVRRVLRDDGVMRSGALDA